MDRNDSKWSKMFQERLGDELRLSLEQHDMTTTALAKKVGISQAQISRLECGKQGFRSSTFWKICAALPGISPSQVVSVAEKFVYDAQAKEIKATAAAS